MKSASSSTSDLLGHSAQSGNHPNVRPQNGNAQHDVDPESVEIKALNSQLSIAKDQVLYHGDPLLADKIMTMTTLKHDIITTFASPSNWSSLFQLGWDKVTRKATNPLALAQLAASLPTNSYARDLFVKAGVKEKYERMLHPPLTYLGDAFKYRQADGKFNSALNPHLGQAGAPYAKTVPAETHPLGALPDPGDIFDKLMARDDKGRKSQSGLSSMLIYHATIIIHDIFRTNDTDKNISDTSSYLDLSPLYGFTEEMQRKVRDDKYKLGLLKPDTFAEDRLLRQPPGVCIMLVMYNRYHNYVATQLRRINENNRFSIPAKFGPSVEVAIANHFITPLSDEEYNKCKELGFTDADFIESSDIESPELVEYQTRRENYQKQWKRFKAMELDPKPKTEDGKDETDDGKKETDKKPKTDPMPEINGDKKVQKEYEDWWKTGRWLVQRAERARAASLALNELAKPPGGDKKMPIEALRTKAKEDIAVFRAEYQAAWSKLDDDLFNTARLITCGMYIQISIHDYLRALMGFHQFDTTFTLDPRLADDHQNVSRGLGNQVTVEFNLLYRFHCAISLRDEEYTEKFLKELIAIKKPSWATKHWNPKEMTLKQFTDLTRDKGPDIQPCDQEFGLLLNKDYRFARDKHTRLFNDGDMIKELLRSMDEPISNFGPRNTPKCMKPVEVLGILQARKWEIGTLNDFREFFKMSRHKTFESITTNAHVSAALRDLYDHPDKVELYPGIFCESFENLNADPGPSGLDSALWAAIFSDAITLVRSDRFYTVDWNTNSLTSWGMKEVTPDNENLKSSVFHRLIQRAFPEWFPSDSVRFFHPFYTAQKNAEYASAQGYEKTFDMHLKEVKSGQKAVNSWEWAEPSKPLKPLTLSTASDIKAVLNDRSDVLVHPVRLRLDDMPAPVADVLRPKTNKTKDRRNNSRLPRVIETDDSALKKYFIDLMRNIVTREVIVMEKDKPVYQVDITRDVAIPVVTRYVADFLGFEHKIRSPEHPHGQYSENEIYQHITNCQTFVAYNVDETKMIRRHKDFKASMTFLYELTRNGHISQYTAWGRFMSAMGALWPFGKKPNAMKQLGLEVARDILISETNHDRAAAMLLLSGLDSAYHAVVAFTSVLDSFITTPDKKANPKDKDVPSSSSVWQELQEIAFNDSEEAFQVFSTAVLKAQKTSVKLPIIRKAVETCTIKFNDTSLQVQKGQTVILNIYQAEQHSRQHATPEHEHYLSYQSTFTDRLSAPYHPKHVSVLSLTVMIKVVAQMKNLRRAHHSQGKLKKIRIDSSYEGYSNYMAPMRMDKIRHDVQTEKARLEDERTKSDADTKTIDTRLGELHALFTEKILRPVADTYLTAEWDEMIPFPTTWKVRFDGFGVSKYGGDNHLTQQDDPMPDDQPPWYQPDGPSSDGGSFATLNRQEAKTYMTEFKKIEQLVSTGCGL
ncbi:heme peroxidase-domain-containing protein [Xylariaceae sp. FL0255]|nr:heme peroxidase-domain-containing protein [Xylariaceae sp. FL0255]